MHQPESLLEATTRIVVAQLGHQSVTDAALPAMIRSVHDALAALGAPIPTVGPVRPEPAVPINRSVRPDHIVCLEDGRKLKMLKRHLLTAFGMTPEQYRARWGLPDSYPMVAPNYAALRRALAVRTRLGHRATA